MFRRSFLQVLAAGASLVTLPTIDKTTSTAAEYTPLEEVKPTGYTDEPPLWRLYVVNVISRYCSEKGVEPGRLILVKNTDPEQYRVLSPTENFHVFASKPKAIRIEGEECVSFYDTASLDYINCRAEELGQRYPMENGVWYGHGPEFLLGWKNQVVTAPMMTKTNRYFSTDLKAHIGQDIVLGSQKHELTKRHGFYWYGHHIVGTPVKPNPFRRKRHATVATRNQPTSLPADSSDG